jgi:hypothetical protein
MPWLIFLGFHARGCNEPLGLCCLSVRTLEGEGFRFTFGLCEDKPARFPGERSYVELVFTSLCIGLFGIKRHTKPDGPFTLRTCPPLSRNPLQMSMGPGLGTV